MVSKANLQEIVRYCSRGPPGSFWDIHRGRFRPSRRLPFKPPYHAGREYTAGDDEGDDDTAAKPPLPASEVSLREILPHPVHSLYLALLLPVVADDSGC